MSDTLRRWWRTFVVAVKYGDDVPPEADCWVRGHHLGDPCRRCGLGGTDR